MGTKYKSQIIIIYLKKCGDTIKNKPIFVVVILLFLIVSLSITSVNGLKLTNRLTQNSEKNGNEKTNDILSDNLLADLKIRESGGDWVDDSITTNVKTKLDFKITVETSREYMVVAILVKLPSIDKNPMFSYDWGTLGLGSSEPKPIFPIGEWTANNTDVIWAWYLVDSSWSKEMTFQATAVKTGSGTIKLSVIGVKDLMGNYDEVYDSVSVTSKKENCKTMFKILGLGYRLLHIFH